METMLTDAQWARLALLLPGRPGTSGGQGAAGRLSQPQSIAVGPDGAIYIADWGNATIRVVR